MAKTFYVNCPCCRALIEVAAEDGHVVNKWTPSERETSGIDKMSAALQKIEDDKKKRATLFDKTKAGLDEKKKKIDEAFKKEVEKVKKEGIGEKPLTPFDLD
ncbi:MAG: hypothetical protein KCHDKBKB_02218 [Elusimicrobia bacterium]|nr:hypothetical protein [Elusimicrobiota bacterium]